MQHPNLSPIVLKCRCTSIAGLALGLALLAYGAEGVTLTLRTDRPELVMGEPLLVELTALNGSDEEVMIRTDGKASSRVLVAPDGTRTALVPPPVYDEFYTNDTILVGSKKTLRLLVAEVADVKRAGHYRLIVEYEDLNASAELAFVVRPYDVEALRARASELYHSATTGGEYGFGYLALAAIEPTIAEPLLCDLMKLNRPPVPVYRLEQIGDDASVRCLVGAFPTAKGDLRESLKGALIRLLRTLPDGPSKESIRTSLGQPPSR